MHPFPPCPIPRCALEWFLAVMAAVAGTTIWLSGDVRLGDYDIALPFLNVSMSAARWGITLWLTCAAQSIALYLAPLAPQRIAAFLACLTWMAFAASTWHAGMIAFAFGVAVLSALGQLYVCAMLQGSRWTG
jgi:hypothetical protein